MVHAHGARGAELAARCGARSIEHGVYLDEQAVAAMAANNTWYVPTLSCSGIPEHRTSVRLAIAAGVPIAMGTDNPVTPHADALEEIALLAEAGLGPVGGADLDVSQLHSRVKAVWRNGKRYR